MYARIYKKMDEPVHTLRTDSFCQFDFPARNQNQCPPSHTFSSRLRLSIKSYNLYSTTPQKFMENEKYLNELNVAVRVVHMACALCEKVQRQLLSSNSALVKSKEDDSLVTVAGTCLLQSFSFPFLLSRLSFLFHSRVIR